MSQIQEPDNSEFRNQRPEFRVGQTRNQEPETRNCGESRITQMSPESKTASTLTEPNPSLASPRAAFAVRLGALWVSTFAFWLLTCAPCVWCGLRICVRIDADGSHNQQPESRQRSHDAPPLPSSMGHIRSPHVRLAARAQFPICYPGIEPENPLTSLFSIHYSPFPHLPYPIPPAIR